MNYLTKTFGTMMMDIKMCCCENSKHTALSTCQKKSCFILLATDVVLLD